MSIGHPASCRECVRCEGDCDGPAFCLSEPGARPCAHDGIWCEDCRFEGCLDCRLEAEREMYASGEYDPRADPFIKDTDNAAEHVERLKAWERDSGFDPTTNSYKKRDAS